MGDASATSLLIVHELATNSLKYGALSNAAGTLEVAGVEKEGEVIITWTELGGPPVAISRGSPGFGSQPVWRSISGQLGGTFAFDWRTEGVVVNLRINKARLGPIHSGATRGLHRPVTTLFGTGVAALFPE